MKSELLFYLAGKTGACEEALRRQLSLLSVELSAVSISTGVSELSYLLSDAVGHANLVFIAGGLGQEGDRNIVKLLRRLLSLKVTSKGGKPQIEGATVLASGGGAGGLVLESGRQSIVVLPDSPEEIDMVFQSSLQEFLMRKYGLQKSPDREREVTPQQVQNRLQRELPAAAPDFLDEPVLREKTGKKKKSKKGLVVFIVLLLVVAALVGVFCALYSNGLLPDVFYQRIID